ncbi:MAG: nitroreductase family protein [Bacteroidia bacterium]
MSAAQKEAPAGSLHELIRKRWSIRAFSDKQLTQEELHTLIEAASWAPSSMNGQPWRFVYMFNGERIFEEAIGALMPGNQSWAKNASVLLLVLAKKNFDQEGNPVNRHALHDSGAATASLLLQGISMGIYGHIMGGFDMHKVRKIFAVPENMEVASIVALGYAGSPHTLEEPFRSRELAQRTRKEVKEIAFHGRLPE